MPNQNGCPRRPEIVGVRRREEAPVGVTLSTILPVFTSTSETHEEPKPAAPQVVEETQAVQVECGGCGCAALRKRLCSGWSGVLFGLLLSGGLLVAIYVATSGINANTTCTSIKSCGELFTDKYVCTTPQCDTSTPYTLSELEGIASTRLYRKVNANFSWTGQGIDVQVNDHHEFKCTKDDSGDRIYMAAEKAALACIQTKIDATDTSVEYIVGSETALLYADEWCGIDDAENDYCLTSKCTCGPTLTLVELLEELANSSGSTSRRMLSNHRMLNSTNTTQAAQYVNNARAVGRKTTETVEGVAVETVALNLIGVAATALASLL